MFPATSLLLVVNHALVWKRGWVRTNTLSIYVVSDIQSYQLYSFRLKKNGFNDRVQWALMGVEVLYPSWQIEQIWLFFSDLINQQDISTHKSVTCSVFFLFFVPFCIIFRGCSMWNSQEISSLWNTQTSPSGTSIHATIISDIFILMFNVKINWSTGSPIKVDGEFILQKRRMPSKKDYFRHLSLLGSIPKLISSSAKCNGISIIKIICNHLTTHSLDIVLKKMFYGSMDRYPKKPPPLSSTSSSVTLKHKILLCILCP